MIDKVNLARLAKRMNILMAAIAVFLIGFFTVAAFITAGV